MGSLKISISGARGIIGESLTPELAIDLSAAFGSYVKGGKIILGYDTRVSGPMLKHAVVAGLMSCGCEIIDIGVVPTPTVQIMVRELDAAGGVIITASHNPIMWNGLKFVRHDGIFLNEDQAQVFLGIAEARKNDYKKSGDYETTIKEGSIDYVSYDKLGSIKSDLSASAEHMKKVFDQVNVDKIRQAKFKVAIDTCNGAGCHILPLLLKSLGCEVTAINDEANGLFAHNPEPVAANLEQLSILMKSGSYDIGFAVDADADRLAIVDETGRPIGEDYTLTLVTDYLLSQKSEGGMVVTNLSTTMAIDKVAQKYNAKVIRTKIGEVNVSEILKSKNATVGGEGNGGVMVPAIGFGRDTLAGIAFVLELMADKAKKVSSIVADMPPYKMVKDKVGFSSPEVLTEGLIKMKKKYANAEINELDGVKVSFENSWLHVRASNTEPIVRLIAEAPTEEEALALIAEVKEFFLGL